MTEHVEHEHEHAHEETVQSSVPAETVGVPVSVLAELLALFKNFPQIIADLEKLLADFGK
jgi:hypothetical protein